MVLSARLMKAWDPTFRRGVISRAQRRSSGATPLLQGSVIDMALRLWSVAPHFAQVLAMRSKPRRGVLVLDGYSACTSAVKLNSPSNIEYGRAV